MESPPTTHWILVSLALLIAFSPIFIVINLQSNSGSYDPIAHLNDIFSHPSTLPSAPTTSKTLHSHVAILNGQIGELVTRQTVADRTSLRSMETAQADLQELFDRIEGVRGRAIATEDAITAMTADIKRLDATKRNLTLSMTALKRLQMLSTLNHSCCILIPGC